MTESIDNYKFDLPFEVTRIKEALGVQAKDIAFVDAGITRQDDRLTAHPRVTGSDSLDQESVDYIISYYQEPFHDHSMHFAWEYDWGTRESIVVFHQGDKFIQQFGRENADLMRLWTLYHETGHAFVFEGPKVDEYHPFLECAADAFAALLFFRRFGDAAENFISMVSWGRAFEAMALNASHLTTPVLDVIIAENKRLHFSKLDAQTIIDLAASYAAAWTPDISDILPARLALKESYQTTAPLNAALLAETCLGARNNFAFYIGAKLLQPLLEPDGIVHDGKPQKLPEDDRKKYAEAIEKRAAEMDLSAVFKKARETSLRAPVLPLLKVSKPKGQKQLIINK